MVTILLLAFIAVPILEIAVFMEIGGRIGLWPTLAVVVATAVAGTWLLRWQGLATLIRAQDNLARGELPIREILDGLCLLFAGALLLTPGFVTDAFGLSLFVPAMRKLVQRPIRRWLVGSVQANIVVDGEQGPGRPGGDANGGPNGGPNDGSVIEGEFEEIGPDDDRPPPRRR